MKIQPLKPATVEPATNPAAAEPVTDSFVLTENDDRSVSFTLIDGTEVKLREVLTKDTVRLEQFAMQFDGKPGASAIVLKLISTLAVQWGDKPGISYDELNDLPLRELKPNLRRFNKVFEFFRLDDLFGNDD